MCSNTSCLNSQIKNYGSIDFILTTEKSREEECKHKITRRCVIEEEIEVLGVKPLCRPPSGNRSTRQSVGIHGLARDPPSLVYSMHLSLPSSYSDKASRNHVLSSSLDLVICPIASTKTWFLPILPSSTKTSLNTLKGCDKCLGYQPLNRRGKS